MVNRRKQQLNKKYQNQRLKKGYTDLDVWNLCYWFIDIIPKMLQEMHDNLHGYPAEYNNIPISESIRSVDLDDNNSEDPKMQEWKEILERMIFLLKEMNEETCSYKNPWKKEKEKAEKQFHKKYGLFGEGLAEIVETGEEKEEHKKQGTRRFYTHADDPDHPEWKILSDEYFRHEQYIWHYRDRCREEFFYLFSKWFWYLWD